MAPIRLGAGIWADYQTQRVDLCPGCMLEELGEPVNEKTVLSALTAAVAWCRIYHGIELVGLDLVAETKRYLERPYHGH